jgi:hypothetical protein
MAFDLLFGVILIILALICVVLLTLWSRRIIERIHDHSPGSLREIQREITDGK